jgi:translation initiation factor 1
MVQRRDENPTVYSTEVGRVCPNCGRPVAACTCKKGKSQAAPAAGADGVVRVSRETKGRKGNGVTLVSGLRLDGEALARLASSLKRLCGTGGTIKDGVIELQGEHRDVVVAELIKQGIRAKKSGG